MSTTAETKAEKKPGIIRRLYNWVLHWAETPYGAPALFVLAFAESSFFPIPPDVLLIALAISVPTRAFRFALICTVGSILGGVLGYVIGFSLYTEIAFPIIKFYHYEEKMGQITQLYSDQAFLYILIAALTPIPYKVFTIASGVVDAEAGALFGSTFWSMLAASAVGRTARFFAVAAMIWKFGPPIKGFIDKYFNLLSILFVILVILGFIVIGFLQ